MARLTTKARKALPKSKFALPKGDKGSRGKPAFPIENRSHAVAAERDAPRARNAGNITAAQERTVERKAKAAAKRMAPKRSTKRR